MVAAVNPVILLVKIPVPVTSDVILSEIVGLALILQHTPRAVTADPPSEEILPPLEAVVVVIVETAVVVIVGTTTDWVVKVISAPYAVPIEFVA